MLATLPAAFVPAAVQAQEAVNIKTTYGDWNIMCAPEGAPCLMQQAANGSDGQPVIEFRIRRLPAGTNLPDGTSVQAAVQIAAPLGTLLIAGVQVSVDGREPRTAPFEVCGPSGCIVRQPLSDDFLNEMKRGNNAKISIYAVPDRLVEVNISLSGFTRAFNSLEP